MAEQFLTLMAELDGDAQSRLSGWYAALKEAGFTGTQTPGLPYHISLGSFPLDKEREAVGKARVTAAVFAAVSVRISHTGLFAGGKVLFAAPDRNPRLDALHNACEYDGGPEQYPWTPHITLLIDEPEKVYAALPVLMGCFSPFTAKITRLRLCAFWPEREILSAQLSGEI